MTALYDAMNWFVVPLAILFLVGFLVAVFLPDGMRLLRFIRNLAEIGLAVLVLTAAAVTAPVWLVWLSWNWWRQLRQAEREGV